MRDCPEVQHLYQNMLSAIRRMFGSVEKDINLISSHLDEKNLME